MKYQPNPPPVNPDELGNYLYNELQRIGEWLGQPDINTLKFEILNAKPDKPRKGLVAYSDGSWETTSKLKIFDGTNWQDTW